MIGYLALLRTLPVIALVAVCSAGVSHASPSDGDETGQCSFVLSAPEVVEWSGANSVMATMHPGPCTMEAVPNSMVVCLSIAGDGSPGQCASKNGPDLVSVYYAYRPGATYVVKGQGCASTFRPPYTLCQNFGPSETTM